MTVVTINLTGGETVLGELVGKPDVVVTLRNPIKYQTSPLSDMFIFSRYNMFAKDIVISFNRDTVIAVMECSENATRHYTLMMEYVTGRLDPQMEQIIIRGISNLEMLLSEVEDNPQPDVPVNSSPQEPGTKTVDEFFNKMPKPKDGKLN